MSRNPNDTPTTGDRTTSSGQNPAAQQPRQMQSPNVVQQESTAQSGPQTVSEEMQGLQSPKTQTREREIVAPDNPDSTAIPVPVLPDPAIAESGFAQVTGKTLAELAESDDPDDTASTKGYGPRIVVLGHIVTGPGTVGTPLQRGNVRYLSELLGDEIMKDEKATARAVRRYLDLGSIREANPEEAQYAQVTFVEGEQALSTSLVDETTKRIAAENEVQRMGAILNKIAKNPGMSPTQAAAQVDAERQGSYVGQGLATGNRV